MPRTRERGNLVVAPSQFSLDAPAPGGIPRGTGTAAAAAMTPEPSLVLGGTAIFLVGRTDVPRFGTHRKEDEEAGTVLRRSELAQHGGGKRTRWKDDGGNGKGRRTDRKGEEEICLECASIDAWGKPARENSKRGAARNSCRA